VEAYVQASYAAFATTLGLSAWALVQRAPGRALPGVDGLLRRMVLQGLHVQGANTMQLLNYRFAYYLIEHFLGLAALGVYSVATQLAEGAWLVPRSLGMVLYSAVSNEPSAERQRALTLTVFKASVAAAAGALLVALLLPDAVYALLFGPEVTGVRPLLACLAPGIVGHGRLAGLQPLLQRRGPQRAQCRGLGAWADGDDRRRPGAGAGLGHPWARP
jgi:O-antigen/teichoic acid export membrane protein